MLAALYNKIRWVLDAEHDRYVLWVPVLMGLGVAWYFHLSTEPPLWLGAALCAGAAMGVWALRFLPLPRVLCILLLLFSFGVTLAQYRTHHVHVINLAEPINYAGVTGRIAEISPKPQGFRLLLEDVTIEKLGAKETPARITLTFKKDNPDLITGQIISVHAGLFPPPSQALPGGFDFNRYFYFREIGAAGYALGPVSIVTAAPSESSFDIWFSDFRHRLTESIRSHLHEPAGAVAAAFVTGETTTIPQSINDNMRIAGLYHLLAVSGMNLSVVAGLAFFTLRLLLAAIPVLALNYPIKKWAAALALIASFIYLRIAGCPVSAERAFFMVSLIFIAILLDRDPMPMRSLAFAAFCILIYEPEAALTASFQLSFSAAASLIASYEWGSGWLARRGSTRGFGPMRIVYYFAAVIGASLVAWIATEPFIAYHFNQFSSFSLLANTIAEPLVSFLLMPLVIAGVLLMPLGLGGLAFTPMQYGVDLLLSIANGVARMPHAMWIVPGPSDFGFCVMVLGITWIYFWRTRLRWAGLGIALMGIATALLYVPPDLLISDDGKHVAVRLDDGTLAMVRGHTTSVGAQSWARASIEPGYNEEADAGEVAPVSCDRLSCIVKVRNHTIAVLKRQEALFEDCANADIVITPYPTSARVCPARTLIDSHTLETSGAMAVHFTQGKEVTFTTVRTAQGSRPWVARVSADDDE